MKVHAKHGKITQIMHGASRNYRYVWDVSSCEKRLMNSTSLDEWRSEAYESAKLFKEKVKKWHDRRILKHEFNVGDKVLLFRSRFRFSPGKLLSRWEGPFHIQEVYRSGAI